MPAAIAPSSVATAVAATEVPSSPLAFFRLLMAEARRARFGIGLELAVAYLRSIPWIILRNRAPGGAGARKASPVTPLGLEELASMLPGAIQSMTALSVKSKNCRKHRARERTDGLAESDDITQRFTQRCGLAAPLNFLEMN